MLTRSPCWNDGEDCPKRHVGCRAECDAWQEYSEIHEKESEEIRKRKSAGSNADAFFVEASMRWKRYYKCESHKDKRR